MLMLAFVRWRADRSRRAWRGPVTFFPQRGSTPPAEPSAAVGAGAAGRARRRVLGERGQGKTRLLRTLVGLLDEWTPVIDGAELAHTVPADHPRLDPSRRGTRRGLASAQGRGPVDVRSCSCGLPGVARSNGGRPS